MLPGGDTPIIQTSGASRRAVSAQQNCSEEKPRHQKQK